MYIVFLDEFVSKESLLAMTQVELDQVLAQIKASGVRAILRKHMDLLRKQNDIAVSSIQL